MCLNKKTIINALEGVQLFQDPTLWEDNGRPTKKHEIAIDSVMKKLDCFRINAKKELKRFPYTNKFMGHLICERINQDYPLSSPIIHNLYSGGLTDFENRLERIKNIPNIETISKNIHAPQKKDQGEETDEIITDIWTEFFVADFLTKELKVEYLEKVVRENTQPAIEFYIKNENDEWILEVARLRKRDFQGDTLPWSTQDCKRQENVNIIKDAIRYKFKEKNKQIKNFVEKEGRDFDKRIVAIKTSQEEYQDCKLVIEEQAKYLLGKGSYPEITHLLLIFDIEKYELLVNKLARQLV